MYRALRSSRVAVFWGTALLCGGCAKPVSGLCVAAGVGSRVGSWWSARFGGWLCLVVWL